MDALMHGRFSLYETPEGGYHIAYALDNTADTRHLEIPAMVVRMAKAGAEGKLSPMKMMREMMANGASD
jgi:hypothetical protein